MNKPLTTFGLVAVAGVLSLCDLCRPGTGTSSVGTAVPGGLLSVAFAAPGHARPPVLAQATIQSATASRTVTLTVVGWTCGGCVLSTQKVLTRLPGVAKARVSYEKGTAVVTYDPRRVTIGQMVAAIRTLGYSATPATPAGG